MIFVDTNVPMYLVGSDHPHKTDAQRLLERATTGRDRLVTSAEVFQEILRRYVAINRREAIQDAFNVLTETVDEIFPIDVALVERAKSIVFAYEGLSARDALHAATMQQHRVTRIMSFDTGFDLIPGFTRLST